MKLNSVELKHVRQIRKALLDLSAPLTVIGGPQGVGKSTIQKAILAAMFEMKKEDRESLRSRFDPDSPPTATIVLSRGDGSAPATLFRRLMDNTGEWREGSTLIRQKGAALARVQASLPISADAAAMLLWGLQEEMEAVVTDFPSDGHSLLTAATIRGAGPDPKEIIDELADEIAGAKRKGQNPGAITQAQNRVNSLQQELENAEAAQESLKKLQRKYDAAKSRVVEAARKCEAAEKEVKKLHELEMLLDAATKSVKKLAELERTQADWDGLNDEIAKAEKSVQALGREIMVLEAQYRVTRDKELGEKILRLQTQILAVEKAEQKYSEIERELKSKRRPDKDDETTLRKLKEQIQQANAQMEASGVRYHLSVEAGSKTVNVSEDSAPAKVLQLEAGKIHEAVVGNVVIMVDALRVGASGKIEVGSLKRTIEHANTEMARLLKKFAVKDEDEFQLLREENTGLQEALKKAEMQVERELKGSSLAALKSELNLAERARKENGVTQQDIDTFGARQLGSAAEVNTELAGKRGEVKTAQKGLNELLAKRPTDSQKAKLKSELILERKRAEMAVAAFKETDGEGREPAEELLEQIKKALDEKRDTLSTLADAHNAAEVELTRLSAELKYAGPELPIPSIRADLEEATNFLRREEILQEARALFKQRIEEKIAEMAASVPQELGDKVSEYLSSLSKGAYVKVNLTEQLTVSGVRERGKSPEQWQPHELSYGERHQAALAVKIAVARALAETTGPIFMILDDSLISFDPERRAAAETLLMDLVADGKLQVILLTCHTDWAEDWKQRAGSALNYIELPSAAEYYRLPPAIGAGERK